MKRFVLFVGGSGARAAEALLVAACAGVLQSDALEVLLADTDRRGLRSAELLQAKYADYDRVQAAAADLAVKGAVRPFRTMLKFRAWPRKMPGGASTLAGWTQGSEEDALLCQALFDQEAAQLDMSEGFHGRRELGQAVFAGLLAEAEGDKDDPMTRTISAIQEAVSTGEEVRVVLCGSVTGGTGAAGMPLMARRIREATQGRARIGAVMLAASGDHEDSAKAKEAVAAFARDEAAGAVCLLGLPRSSCTPAPADYAHLTDWLAVYCMDVLLHRPAWPEGVFTVKAEAGPLGWSVFGKAAERYRLAYGRLIKAAAAWTYIIGPKVEKRLAHPFILRDGLWGWYAHFFRHSRCPKEECLLDAEQISRLMTVVLVWLGGLLQTLPPEMTHSAEMLEAQEAAHSHYTALAELVSQLTMLDAEVQKNVAFEEGMVYRNGTGNESESAQELERVEAVKQEIAWREGEQDRLNRRLGGAGTVQMLQHALLDAEEASQELRARYDEANRRIDHAESIAAPEDLYRITDARTKLDRMVRHQQMLDAREARIREETNRAMAGRQRFMKPQLSGAAQPDELFCSELTERLLQKNRRFRPAEVEALWPRIVRPGDGRTLKMTLKRVRRAQVNPYAPVISLLHALMMNSMEEK